MTNNHSDPFDNGGDFDTLKKRIQQMEHDHAKMAQMEKDYAKNVRMMKGVFGNLEKAAAEKRDLEQKIEDKDREAQEKDKIIKDMTARAEDMAATSKTEVEALVAFNSELEQEVQEKNREAQEKDWSLQNMTERMETMAAVMKNDREEMESLREQVPEYLQAVKDGLTTDVTECVGDLVGNAFASVTPPSSVARLMAEPKKRSRDENQDVYAAVTPKKQRTDTSPELPSELEEEKKEETDDGDIS